MSPHRISVKYFVADAADLQVDGMIPVFHDWIRRAAVPGMLIDVADYGHMVDGPGVLLIGHDVEYGLDLGEGRPGMLHRRKRGLTGDLRADVATTLHETLIACQALTEDTNGAIRFATSELVLTFPDRLAAPNNDVTFTAMRGPVEAAINALYGDGAVKLARDTSDVRDCLTIRVSAAAAPDIDTLLQRSLAASA